MEREISEAYWPQCPSCLGKVWNREEGKEQLQTEEVKGLVRQFGRALRRLAAAGFVQGLGSKGAQASCTILDIKVDDFGDAGARSVLDICSSA